MTIINILKYFLLLFKEKQTIVIKIQILRPFDMSPSTYFGAL